MSLYVSDVIERVNDILNDVLSQRWKDSDLMPLLNEAQLAICARRPDASVVVDDFTCAASSRQKLPDGGMRLIEVQMNTITGQPITKIDKQYMDNQVPAWRKTNPSTQIEHYIFDDRTPKYFYLYPTPAASHRVDIVYAVAPERVAGGGSDIGLDDVYFNPLVDFMLYRAFLIDVENPANQARADARFAAFRMGLGEKVRADAAVSPNNNG